MAVVLAACGGDSAASGDDGSANTSATTATTVADTSGLGPCAHQFEDALHPELTDELTVFEQP